jgi:hypothetical protein
MFDPIKSLMKDTPLEVKRDEGKQTALQQFCQSHGILGVNCGNMDPMIAMGMIKARMGDRSPNLTEVKKQILNG